MFAHARLRSVPHPAIPRVCAGPCSVACAGRAHAPVGALCLIERPHPPFCPPVPGVAERAASSEPEQAWLSIIQPLSSPPGHCTWTRRAVRSRRESIASSSKMLFNSCRRRAPQDAAREQDNGAAPDVEDDAHGLRKCKTAAVVQARCGLTFCGGQELQLNSLNAWCKVTVLCLKNCRLGRTGAVSLAEAIASSFSAFLVELDLERNDLGRSRWRAGAGRDTNPKPNTRLNTTLTSLDLGLNDL